MTPLRITAHMRGAISLPGGGIAIDGLLAWAQSQVDGLPPLQPGDPVVSVEIPIAREPGGRFHLASFGIWEAERHDMRWINRRPVVAEAQLYGDAKVRRLNIGTGPNKGYRIPLETIRLLDDRIDWYAIGDADPIRALLALVSYLGKKRSVGNGAVESWTVKPCEPWGDGFPVVRRGNALRPLPLDWLGLADPEPGQMPITYPYWMYERGETVAVPALRF